MLFPIEQRHASPRNGAAIEFVQQEPCSVGVELAGCAGSYCTTCVDVTVGTFCAGAEELSFADTDDDDVGALTVENPENEKNWVMPNATTNMSTTMTMILLVRFMVTKI